MIAQSEFNELFSDVKWHRGFIINSESGLSRADILKVSDAWKHQSSEKNDFEAWIFIFYVNFSYEVSLRTLNVHNLNILLIYTWNNDKFHQSWVNSSRYSHCYSSFQLLCRVCHGRYHRGNMLHIHRRQSSWTRNQLS